MAIQQINMSCQNTNEGDMNLWQYSREICHDTYEGGMNLWQCSREIWVGEDGLPLQHPPQTWSALWFWSGLEIAQSGGDNKSTKGAKIEWAKTWSMMRFLVSWEKYFFCSLEKNLMREDKDRKWGEKMRKNLIHDEQLAQRMNTESTGQNKIRETAMIE